MNIPGCQQAIERHVSIGAAFEKTRPLHKVAPVIRYWPKKASNFVWIVLSVAGHDYYAIVVILERVSKRLSNRGSQTFIAGIANQFEAAVLDIVQRSVRASVVNYQDCPACR